MAYFLAFLNAYLSDKNLICLGEGYYMSRAEKRFSIFYLYSSFPSTYQT